MRKLEQRHVSRNPHSKTLMKVFLLDNGLEESYYIEENKDSVCIFPILEDNNKVMLVKQFRANTETINLELPGGGIEPNETSLEAAKRELAEECGIESEDWTEIAAIKYSPYDSGTRYMYLAQNCKENGKGLNLDPNEALKPIIVTLEEVKELIKKGRIRGFDCIYMSLNSLNLL